MKKPKPPQLQWEPAQSLGKNAAQHLPGLAAEYFAAGRSLLAEERKLEDFHQFRITTKRFRYTLEMFRPAYGPVFAQRIKKIQKVQEILGDLNDASVLHDRFGKQGARDAALGEVVRSITAKIPELKAQFTDFWKGDLDAPGQEQQWQRYLARPLGYAAARTARKEGK